MAQIVIQPLGKQRALTAVIANDKTRHRILRPNRRRILSSRTVFTKAASTTQKPRPGLRCPLYLQQRILDIAATGYLSVGSMSTRSSRLSRRAVFTYRTRRAAAAGS